MTRRALALEVAGWSGTALLLTGFLLTTQGSLPPRGAPYLAMNLLGSAGVGLNAWSRRAWPAFAVEAAWFVVALLGLARLALAPGPAPP